MHADIGGLHCYTLIVRDVHGEGANELDSEEQLQYRARGRQPRLLFSRQSSFHSGF